MLAGGLVLALAFAFQVLATDDLTGNVHSFAVSKVNTGSYEYDKSKFLEIQVVFPSLSETAENDNKESDSEHSEVIAVCAFLEQKRTAGWERCLQIFCKIIQEEEEEVFYEINPSKQNNSYCTGCHHRILFHSNSTGAVAVRASINTTGLLGHAQAWIALVILIVVYVLMAFETAHRTIIACAGVFVVFVFLALSGKFPEIHTAASWIDPGTILLLWSMMTIVSVLSPTGIFEYLAVLCCKWSGGNVRKLVTILWLLTAVLSALLDNVTCCLLIGPVAHKIADLLQISPVPILMGAAMLSNIGGVATMIGDPPNLIIGKMLDISFIGFVVNLLPCILFCVPLSIVYLLWCWRCKIRGTKVLDIDKLMEENKLKNHPLAIKCIIVMIFVLLLFFTQTFTGIEPAYSALFGAAVLMLISSRKSIEKTMEGIDWETLIFFSAIFVFIQGLGQMGLIRLFGDALVAAMKLVPHSGQLPLAIFLLIWVSAIISAFIDNVPWTVTMASVIKLISKRMDLPLSTLAWSLSFGACLGGNGTSIGASANLVIVGLLRSWSYPVHFMYWFRIGFPLMIITTVIATAYSQIVYVAMGLEWKL